MKAKITQTLACIAPRLHRYLQSVLSTFIKLQHNPCPESTDWKQYFLHFNYRRSWLDGAVWPQYHSLTNRRKQSLKFAQTYWHILLFSNSTERAADTIIISGWRAPDYGPVTQSSWQYSDDTTLMIPRSGMERLTSPAYPAASLPHSFNSQILSDDKKKVWSTSWI